MRDPTCDEVRGLAPELALGIATGEERARALVHMASCTECRSLVDELSRAADPLLLLAPPKEPPIGFEARVVRRVRGLRPGSRLRWAAALLSVAVIASVATALGMRAASEEDRELARRHRELLAGDLKGELISTRLLTADGGPAGQVFAYDGPTKWVFMVIDARRGSGTYEVVFFPKGAAGITLGKVRLVDGRGSWGRTTRVGLRELTIRLLAEDGEPAFEAVFGRKK